MKSTFKRLGLQAFAMPFFAMLILTSCGGDAKKETAKADEGQETQETATPTLDQQSSEVLESIPNPLELSTLLKDLGHKYDAKDLNNHESVSKYGSGFKKALNLGIYSTDLGYANLYEENQDALNYLNAVKKLADGISIGQFFDYTTLKTLVEDSDNLEKLVEQTNVNLENINNSLKEQNRESLSILMLTGGWLEVTYLCTRVYAEKSEKPLMEAIADQKLTLERLLLVLDVYQEKEEIKALAEKMKELRKVYESIKVETIVKPTTEAKSDDGSPIYTSQDITVYEVTDEDIKAVSEKVAEIRNMVVAE